MKIALSEPFQNPEQVMGEVRKTIPPAELKECKGLEMTIALPKSHVREFAGVIRLLESEEMRRAFKISTISMHSAPPLCPTTTTTPRPSLWT